MPIKLRPDIERALTRLTMSQPWFASLALRLDLQENSNIPTAATDGERLYFNPKWFDGLDRKWQEAVFAHEVMHCCCSHMTRRGNREPGLWNEAGDHVINLELIEGGFELPTQIPGICTGKCGIECCHMADPRFKGMSTEQVYAILQHERKDQKKGHGKGYVDQLGAPMDASGGKDPAKDGESGGGSSISPAELERIWAIAQEQASAIASKAGHLPGGASRLAHATTKPQIPWQETVQRYLTAMGDTSWTRPNRRYVSRELYLPGTLPGRPGKVDFYIDVSGSISQEMMNYFASEITGVLSACGFPERVRVLYWDTKVQTVEEPTQLPLALQCVGGGGTAINPVFEWVAANGEKPLVAFILTDLELGDTPQQPDFDCIWITPKWASKKAPFGELVQIDTGSL